MTEEEKKKSIEKIEKWIRSTSSLIRGQVSEQVSEQEKKAIEDIKKIVTDLEDAEDGAIIALQQEEIDSLKILAELIEKQQKEIEKLKEENDFLKELYKKPEGFNSITRS